MAPNGDILEEFLERGRRSIERQISVVRIVLALLAISWELVLLVGHQTTEATIARLAVDSLGLIGSLLILSTLKHRPNCSMRTLGLTATALDVLLALGVTLPATLWPRADYYGFASNLSNSVLFLAVLASGMRMSDAAARLGVVLTLGAFVLATTIDQLLWGLPLAHPVQLSAGITVLVGACMLALFLARRTRRLLSEGVAFLADAQRARVAAQDTLGTYVSPQVARKALAGAPTLGGVRRPVAVMFSDLRGFTAYGEALPPEQLVSELNAYLEAMAPAITAHDGMIDKFMGDGIMIVFGATETDHDDARRAILTAAAMGRALEGHNAARASRGLPPLAHGIGIHWGTAIIGNVGTAARMNHTAIGDVVNTASRLQAETKRLGVPVLVSGAAVGAARAATTTDQDPLPALHAQGLVQVRGRSEELEVYALADSAATTVTLLARAERARVREQQVARAAAAQASSDERAAGASSSPSGRMVVVDLIPQTGHGRVG